MTKELRVRGRAMRRDGGGRRRTRGAKLAQMSRGDGGGGGGLYGASKMGMMSPAPMSASKMLVMRTPLIGFGEAAAKDGREYWTAASTKTTAFDATSGKSVASIMYSSVLLRSSPAASLMSMFCCGGGGASV